MKRNLGDNTFKIGIFSSNVWGGLTQTTAPERWVASWPHNLTLAQDADAAGIDFLLPLGNWLGLHGDAPTSGFSFETVTWAAGLLASTSRIKIFATVHVTFTSPIAAAKQVVTCDHIGEGRFGLNVVSGINPAENSMFGIDMLPHDERYAYAREWVDVVRRIWETEEAFDYKGDYFDLHGVWGNPKPFGGSSPLVVSAGSSGAGRRFAAEHADALFMLILSEETLADEITAFRKSAGRELDVLGSGHVICRPTRREAEEYLHYLVEENGDWAAADTLFHDIFPNSESIPHDQLEAMRSRLCSGHGTYRIVGSPDDVAESMSRLSGTGLSGMAVALPNYLDDFPILRDEVLPRLESAGLRLPADSA